MGERAREEEIEGVVRKHANSQEEKEADRQANKKTT